MVFARIRARDPGLPILLCGGYRREAVPGPRGPVEPRGILQKPFSFAQLETALLDLMGKVPARRGRPGPK